MEGIYYNEFIIQGLASKSVPWHKLKGPCPKPSCRMIPLNGYHSGGQLILEVIYCRGWIHFKHLIKHSTLLASQETQTFPAIPTMHPRAAAASCGRVPSRTLRSLSLPPKHFI